MKFRSLPSIVGKGLKKGLIAGRSRKIFCDGRDLYIVWLKRHYNTGEEFDFKDVDKVDTHIHFADIGSLKMMIDVLQRMHEQWQEGEHMNDKCERAEKHNGKCLGYQKSEWNDEPTEQCESCQFFEGLKDGEKDADRTGD